MIYKTDKDWIYFVKDDTLLLDHICGGPRLGFTKENIETLIGVKEEIECLGCGAKLPESVLLILKNYQLSSLLAN